MFLLLVYVIVVRSSLTFSHSPAAAWFSKASGKFREVPGGVVFGTVIKRLDRGAIAPGAVHAGVQNE